MVSDTVMSSQTRKENQQVVESNLEKLGPLVNEIGAVAAEMVGGDPDGLYIFAELTPGRIHAGVFKDEGRSVRYYDPTEELTDLILEAWEMESAKRMRWTVMEYEVRGTEFDVKLIYPEELNPAEDLTDRRRAGLKRRYGDKPVIYPPMPEHSWELKSE